jgi:hypothetical protein
MGTAKREPGQQRRPRPSRDHTRISNSWVRDATLDWACRGLLAWFMSHAEHFHVDEQAVISAGPAGREAVRSMLRRLEAAGYLVRTRVRDAAGRLRPGVNWRLNDPHTLIPGMVAFEPTYDGKPVLSPDQAKRDVSPGQTCDGKPVLGDSSSLLEDKQKTKNLPRHSARASTNEGGTPVKTPISHQRPLPLFVAPAPPPPADPNAGQVVAAWVDYCKDQGVILPRRIIGQYARLIGEALTDGFPANLVKTTLAKMLADAVADRPALLPNRLVAAQTGPERRTPRGLVEHGGRLVTDRHAANLSLVEQFQDEERRAIGAAG